VEAGFGTPREAMHLRRSKGELRLVTVKTDRDVTAPMDRLIRRRLPALATEDLSGYVLKKNSPSCGLERVKVYDSNGASSSEKGRGLFADALITRYPLLPVEEEGRLSDPRLRENFVERVFAYSRLQALFSQPVERRIAGRVSHGTQADPNGALAGRLPPSRRAGRRAATTLAGRSAATLFAGVHGRPGSHRDATSPYHVLQHMAGYFKNLLDRESKAELQSTIEDYRRGLIRSSSRSRCCVTTSACTAWNIWRGSCICSPIRRS
jgi:uncharacterized protein YbbK (DUF523 family)